MTDAATRRVTILDTMALVAVAAISAAWLRFMFFFQDSPPFPFRGLAALYIGPRLVVSIVMLSLIPLRLFHPRPPVAQLWQQPGWLACNAVALTCAFIIIRYIPHIVANIVQVVPSSRNPRNSQTIYHLLFMFSSEIGESAGIAIAASWATLALTGGWKSEKVWIDRAGRAGGFLLIMYPILGLIFWFFA
jgi:hypothetical protein